MGLCPTGQTWGRGVFLAPGSPAEARWISMECHCARFAEGCGYCFQLLTLSCVTGIPTEHHGLVSGLSTEV